MVQFARESKLHSQKLNNEIKNQGYVTEAFLESPGVNSEPRHEVMFRSAISDSWCPCDGTCPKCNEAKNYAKSTQTKLKISKPGDPYEKEADRVAEQVIRLPVYNGTSFPLSNQKNERKDTIDPARKTVEEYDDEHLSLSPKSWTRSNSETRDETSNEIANVNNSGGSSIEEDTKDFMESHLGYDFSKVRIHDDIKSDRLAKSVSARAFTYLNHIFLASGESRSNKKLLAHELTHVIQQDESVSGKIQRQPQAASPGSKTKSETITTLRNSLLESLRRTATNIFLGKLRELDTQDLQILENDILFMTELNTSLRGLPLWISLMTLRFGKDLPYYVREIIYAVASRDIQKIKDLLRVFSDRIRPESVQRIRGVREMLDQEFRTSPEHDELMRLTAEVEMGRTKVLTIIQEAHYETPNGGGPYVLKKLTGRGEYSIARTSSELRIIVKIQLEKPDDEIYYLPRNKEIEWRNGIDSAWNNRFKAFNGTTQLKIIFVPKFVTALHELPDHVVKIIESREYFRSDEHNWWIHADGTVIAHEFGHMLGNPDEYNLPASLAEILPELGLTPQEITRSTVEGITGAKVPAKVGGHSLPGIMGRRGEQVALHRHVWPILEHYNRRGKPPSEADYYLFFI
jgi:hypothetical protein